MTPTQGFDPEPEVADATDAVLAAGVDGLAADADGFVAGADRFVAVCGCASEGERGALGAGIAATPVGNGVAPLVSDGVTTGAESAPADGPVAALVPVVLPKPPEAPPVSPGEARLVSVGGCSGSDCMSGWESTTRSPGLVGRMATTKAPDETREDTSNW
jgi:hypothetical protein